MMIKWHRSSTAAAIAVAMTALITTRVLAAPATDASVTVVASDDTYVRGGATMPVGQAGALIVGGAGAAVTYLKFDVTTPPAGDGPPRVSLVLVPLRLAGAIASTEIDVHAVADTSWSEDSLVASTAPVPGPVVASAMADATGVTLTFDLTTSVAGPGTYAFALTTPPGAQQRLFVSKEGGGAAGGPQLALSPGGGPTPTPTPTITPTAVPTITPTPTPTGPPTSPPGGPCVAGVKLVPTCGVMLGVAPGARTDTDRFSALTAFESEVGQDQDIFHAYHHGLTVLFPTAEEIAISQQAGHHRILFLNWKPQVASWASIAAGNPRVDTYIDQLAAHIKATYHREFFFTVNHEPENDVVERAGSGNTASDFAAMYRHVILRLRADGVTNMVTVVDYMAYVPWDVQPWFDDLYPGDDVVDWIGWDMYGYSTPHAYGYGDFAEMLTRTNSTRTWPGFYAWAVAHFPGKPFMVAEWGVWYGAADPTHQAAVFDSTATEIAAYPQIKALVYFDTPNDAQGRNSLIAATPGGLSAYRAMSEQPIFQVAVP